MAGEQKGRPKPPFASIGLAPGSVDKGDIVLVADLVIATGIGGVAVIAAAVAACRTWFAEHINRTVVAFIPAADFIRVAFRITRTRSADGAPVFNIEFTFSGTVAGIPRIAKP